MTADSTHDWAGRFDGQVALVSGAASGIGRSAALALGAAGARLSLIDRDGANLRRTVSALEARGVEAIAAETDIGAVAPVEAAVAATLQRFGQIDLLAHCAGVAARGPILDSDDRAWLDVIDTNLNGTFYLVRAVGRAMRARGKGGAMVLLASDRGLLGARHNPAYAASKGGVIAFMRSAAQEFGPLGITVNAINPGLTNTPMTQKTHTPEMWERKKADDPLGQLSEPEDIVEIILFLAGPGRRFMTGQLVTTRMRLG